MEDNELQRWYAEQYFEATGLGEIEGGARFSNLAATFAPPPDGAWSTECGRTRVMSQFLSMLGLPPLPAELRPVVLTASAGTHSPAVAIALAEPDAAEPEFILWGATMESRDGEYRSYFVTVPEFMEGLPGQLEAETVAALDRGELVLGVEADEAGRAWADASRAGALGLIELLRDTLRANLLGVAPPHMSRDVVGFLAEAARAAPELAAAALAQKTDDRHVGELTPGAKLVPMFIRELLEPGDMRHGVWREAAAARAAADLVVNFVSPSFPLYGGGTYVRPGGARLYNNEAMRDRFARGRAAGRAIEALREARRALAGQAAVDTRAAELDNLAVDALEFAQSFLLVSDTSFLHRIEDVGITLGSLRARSRFLADAVETDPGLDALRLRHRIAADVAVSGKRPFLEELRRSFATPEGGARLLFELAYATHCLHARAGVAHADLHANNLTVHFWSHKPAEPGDYAAFAVGDRDADTYVFPASGMTGSVIDFSRAVLGPGFRGATPAFYRDQVARVLRALHRHSPEFVEKHQAELKALTISNFDLVFPLVCAGDFVFLGATLVAFLAGPDPAGDLPVDASLAAIAGALEAEAVRFFAEGLDAAVAVARGADSGRLAARGLPGAAVLPAAFGAWRFPRWASADPARLRAARLVDVYRLANPLRFSSSGLERRPPWADPEEIARHLGAYQMRELFPGGLGGPAPPDGTRERAAEAERAVQEAEDALPPGGAGRARSWLDN